MKKYLISAVAAMLILALVLPAFAQEQERARQPRQGRTPGTRTTTRPARLARPGERWQDMSEQERQEYMAKMRERQQQIMEQQIANVKEEYEGSINELKAIHELALKEKAEQTAKAIEKLIEKRQKECDEAVEEIKQRSQRFDQMMRRDRPPTPEAPERLQAGRRAPPFTLNTFDGKTLRLADYRGKIVVLEWLNFECPFSLYHYEKVQTMANLAKKYKDKNVVWLTINSTSHTTQQANIDFAKKYKLESPILDDRSGKVGHAYDAKTTPHMYIINPRGRILYEGAIDNAPTGNIPEGQELTNYVDKALAELTAGKPISTPETKPYGCTVKYPK